MKVLFLHNNFPAQYRWLAPALAANKDNQIVFGSIHKRADFPDVRNVFYEPKRKPSAQTHHYLLNVENAVLHGQAAFRMAVELRNEGFIPDIICAHAGWGPAFFMKEIFPKSALLSYFEWFYNATGSDFDFFPENEHTFDDLCRLRMKNSALLTDLNACDWGTGPTRWQWQQLPKEYRQNKVNVVHDGVNTKFLVPDTQAKFKIGELDLSDAKEIVTYVGRGMEPYRGFMQFMETAAILLEKRPNLHIVVIGSERVVYGKQRKDGKTYKDDALEQFNFDEKRLHFTGSIPYGELKLALQATDCHVYLTAPFVLSWSMLEAMACGAVIVGSSTEPVKEVIKDGENGFLVDFFKPKDIAKKVIEVLKNKEDMKKIKEAARKTIEDKFNYEVCLKRYIQLMTALSRGEVPDKGGPLFPDAS